MLVRSALGVLSLAGLSQLVGGELSDTPSVANFVRRATLRATVLGNYVYFDGGEISQLENDKFNQGRASNQVNSTLSIDISKSWTNTDVAFNAIPKKLPTPTKTNQVLWTDAQNGAFYIFGGKWAHGENMAETALWKFTTDGQGGGEWSLQSPGNPSLFNGLVPSEQSVYVTVNDTGFAIGGIAHGWTQIRRLEGQAVAGMLGFNMTTKVWNNGTLGFSPIHTLSGGSAHHVPSFGPNGLVVLLGGESHPVDKLPVQGTGTYHDLRNLTFFDPQTKTTYWQLATGDIPPHPRTGFCVTGFRDPEGGYEMFLFGGDNQRDKISYQDAYVLSLPSFVWTRLPEPPAGPRAYHDCVSVGKRQVLSIGGTNRGWEDKDQAPQGLLLFDMTMMEWKDAYDAEADDYVRADLIKSRHNDGLEKMEWSSPEVQKLFQVSESTEGTPQPTSEPPASSAPVGAIVGGVVGGAAAITLVAVVVWWVLRRRRAKNEDAHDGDGAMETAEVGGESKYLAEVAATHGHTELSTGYDGKTAQEEDVQELESGYQTAELPSEQKAKGERAVFEMDANPAK
ncbi:hypothetical protein OQA88_1457 [Cercophora sp. LCS_1]